MFTVICLVTLVGTGTPQEISFEYTDIEANKFMVGYGYMRPFTEAELKKEVCKDIGWAIEFEEGQEE